MQILGTPLQGKAGKTIAHYLNPYPYLQHYWNTGHNSDWVHCIGDREKLALELDYWKEHYTLLYPHSVLCVLSSLRTLCYPEKFYVLVLTKRAILCRETPVRGGSTAREDGASGAGAWLSENSGEICNQPKQRRERRWILCTLLYSSFCCLIQAFWNFFSPSLIVILWFYPEGYSSE